MRHHRLLALAVLAALALPARSWADASADAPWSLTAQFWGGRSKYDVVGLRSGIASVDRKDVLDGTAETVGGSLVLRLGWLNLGALYEGALLRSRADSAVITPLVGIAWNLSEVVRLDLNGELGGHRITNIGISSTVDASEARSVWLPYVGIRPSLSLRLPVGPARLVLSATPFARWDLVRDTVEVSVGGTSIEKNSYDVGGSTFGVVGGVGLEI